MSNWKLSFNRASKIFFQIAFAISPAKDDRTDSIQKERLGLRFWTVTWTIGVWVDESKCRDIPISEFSIFCEHLPFLLGYKPILGPLLVHRNQAIWR